MAYVPVDQALREGDSPPYLAIFVIASSVIGIVLAAICYFAL